MQAVYTTNVLGPVTKETRSHFYRRKCKQSIPQMFMDLSPKKQGATFTGENASSLYHKCSWTCHQRNKGPLLQEKMQAVYTTNVHGPVTKETRGHFYRRKCKQSIPQMFMDLSLKRQGATFTGENAFYPINHLTCTLYMYIHKLPLNVMYTIHRSFHK